MFRLSSRVPALARQRIITYNGNRRLLTSARPAVRRGWTSNALLGTAFVAVLGTGIVAWQAGPIFLDSEVKMFPMEGSDDFVGEAGIAIREKPLN
jgi:hypothetical protein